jgi:hypothetical protein
MQSLNQGIVYLKDLSKELNRPPASVKNWAHRVDGAGIMKDESGRSYVTSDHAELIREIESTAERRTRYIKPKRSGQAIPLPRGYRTVAQVAKELCASENTVRSYIHKQNVEVHKQGRRVLVPQHTFEHLASVYPPAPKIVAVNHYGQQPVRPTAPRAAPAAKQRQPVSEYTHSAIKRLSALCDTLGLDVNKQINDMAEKRIAEIKQLLGA